MYVRYIGSRTKREVHIVNQIRENLAEYIQFNLQSTLERKVYVRHILPVLTSDKINKLSYVVQRLADLKRWWTFLTARQNTAWHPGERGHSIGNTQTRWCDYIQKDAGRHFKVSDRSTNGRYFMSLISTAETLSNSYFLLYEVNH